MMWNRVYRFRSYLRSSLWIVPFVRTPNWEDFVHLAFGEIRACGSNNLQIVRRLRAMIENLIQTLPSHRHPALLSQLNLLEREIKRRFRYQEERALAAVADSQGLGGHSGMQVEA
jgi:uncharacterized membrane protein